MIRLTEPCPQCEGTGWADKGELVEKVKAAKTGKRVAVAGAACPSCFLGQVPDDATIEAAAAGFVASLVSLRVGISNALIAAARHQREGQ